MKWLIAVVFGAVTLVAGVGPALGNHALTPNVIVAAAAAGILTALGKVMDPNSVIEVHPLVTALVLGVVAIGPMVTDAMTNGTIADPTVVGGIVVAFITAFWGKWSEPTGFRLARWNRSPGRLR